MGPIFNEATITRFALRRISLAHPTNHSQYHEFFIMPTFLNINTGYQHSFQTIRGVLMIIAFATTP
jgi:hypothetical protein